MMEIDCEEKMTKCHDSHGVLCFPYAMAFRGFSVVLLVVGWSYFQFMLSSAFSLPASIEVVSVASPSKLTSQVPPKSEWMPPRTSKTISIASGLSHGNSSTKNGNLTCIAWRATYQCQPIVHFPLLGGTGDVSCDTKVPAWGSGYCEMRTENNELVKVFQKSCREGYWRSQQFKTFFSCDMAASWLSYKSRMINHRPSRPIECAGMHEEPSRGIVMQVYSKVLASAYAVIRTLRDIHHCKLPIELWTLAGELTETDPVVRELLALPNVRMRFITDPSIKSYMSKPYSIAYSAFDQLLFLDSDNFPIRDPTYLFETDEFEQHGAVFWKDYWRAVTNDFYFTKNSLIWELFDVPMDSPMRTEMEMESGQVLIDRRRTKKPLHALLFLANTFHELLEPLDLLLGDKDLYRLVFHGTNFPFHYIHHPPSLAGHAPLPWMSQHAVCGQTMVQPDPMGVPLFFHRNQAKIGDKKTLYMQWEKGMRFVGTNPETQYGVTMWLSPWRMNLCFHPVNAIFFEEIYYRGSDVEVFEASILSYAREALDIIEQNSTH
jgi:Mannosyltransferase putative